jgi:hypothetical protein
MAVGTPVAGTSSQDDGDTLELGLPASVAADDIIILWAVFHGEPGTDTIPTTITWPGGYTEIAALATFNAGGTQTGVVGAAWTRAAGGESGTVNVSSNGSVSATAGSLGNCCRVPGCVTSGDPWEDLATANPNYTTTVDRPAVDMTRSNGGLSLLLHGNTDNVNIATPTDWTALTSNGGTQGADSGFDSDYRSPGATGTYDPANGTQTSGNARGWAIIHLMLTDTSSGTPQLMAAVVNGSSTVAASLLAQNPLAAVVAGASVVTSSARVEKPLAAAVAGASAVTAVLHIGSAVALAAVVNGASSVAASLQAHRALAAVVNGASAVSASVLVEKPLTAIVSGASAVTAGLRDGKPLAAVVAAQSAVTARLNPALDTVGRVLQRVGVKLGIGV